MELPNLLSVLSLSAGINVILAAVRFWIDHWIPFGTLNVSDAVQKFCESQYHLFHNRYPIAEWTPENYRERLVLSFHLRMRNLDPIKEAKPPTPKLVIKTLSDDEVTQRAHQLAVFMFDKSIPEALDFLEKIIVNWSLGCDEEWESERHLGYIFYVLAEITER